MTKFYIDITLISDTEISLNFLLSKVYFQLHLAIAELKKDNVENILFSFPMYRNEKKKTLGNKIRIFANESQILEKLNLSFWLKNFQDYVHMKSIQHIPENIDKYAIFYREAIDANINRMARRLSKRKNISLKAAQLHYESYKKKESTFPFVWMKSTSSVENNGYIKFPLHIKREFTNISKINTSTSYGLSHSLNTGPSTVPIF